MHYRGGGKYFSTIDVKKAFWNIPVDEESRKYTAFTSYEGVFEFLVMPFGLCNSSATFQRLMENVLRGLVWKTTLVYVDDAIVFGADFMEHVDRLCEVLDRIRKAGLKLSATKCKFMHPTIEFLGCRVSENGVTPSENKTKLMADFNTPKDAREVKTFLGLTGYFRRFIPAYARLANPLNKLTHKNVDFVWTDECQNSFETLKRALVSEPLLKLPDFTQPFSLYTDASGFTIGSVLTQVQRNGVEAAIAYGGRQLSAAERNYSTTDAECLAVVDAVRHFAPYLQDTRFTVYTDHASLEYILSSKHLTGRFSGGAKG